MRNVMDGVVIDALGVALGRSIECVCRSCVYTVCVVEVVLVRVCAVRLVAKGGWCWQRCFRYVDHPRDAVSRAARVALAPAAACKEALRSPKHTRI